MPLLFGVKWLKFPQLVFCLRSINPSFPTHSYPHLSRYGRMQAARVSLWLELRVHKHHRRLHLLLSERHVWDWRQMLEEEGIQRKLQSSKAQLYGWFVQSEQPEIQAIRHRHEWRSKWWMKVDFAHMYDGPNGVFYKITSLWSQMDCSLPFWIVVLNYIIYHITYVYYIGTFFMRCAYKWFPTIILQKSFFLVILLSLSIKSDLIWLLLRNNKPTMTEWDFPFNFNESD